MSLRDIDAKIQVGGSATAANNLCIDTSANNGTATIYFGNAGTAATTVANIAATGRVSFLQNPTVTYGGLSQVQVMGFTSVGSTNTQVRRFTTVVTNQGSDIVYADSATLGSSFTIKTNGIYAISCQDTTGSTNYGIAVNKNLATGGSLGTTILTYVTTATANYLVDSSVCAAYLVPGDVIYPLIGASAAISSVSANYGTFTITRIA